MTPRRFVVLDRDGTIIVERHYLADPAQVELIPGAAAALSELSRLGLGLIVITNQSAVGRKLLELATLERIHARVQLLLAAAGVWLQGIYVCPHAPEEGCACRKPLPGLLQAAAQEHGFVPAECVVIGDKTSDMELGRRCGATTLLVKTGYGAEVAAAGTAPADYVVDDLPAAVPIIRQMLSIARVPLPFGRGFG